MANPRIVDAFTIHPINVEPLRNRQSRRSIIREFGLNTTAHGIPGIARSRSTHNCMFWSISTLIFTGITLYFVIESIRAYFDYLTQTNVAVVVDWPQYFPAFSICNRSPIRFDKFIGPFLNYTNSHNLTNTTDNSSISSYQSLFLMEFVQFTMNNNQPLKEFMYPLSSMLIECKYNGFNCTTDDFLTFMSPNYGLCYTFNAKVKNRTLRYATDNGGTGKLELRLYTHTHQYVRFVADSVGMVGMIHDNTQMPLIDIAGLYFGTGRKHKLSFTKRSYSILSSPYSSCTDQVSFAMQALFNSSGNADYGYSQLTCGILCGQAYA
ncbi:unnamed protein product [Rotaria sp. Silwood1]|nr:unnamed protein product [Rotaria sp. Silwood1]CAF1619575.1 unnamed protein product [Rotaria sp. Silwood1]CAF3713918.1 unnamed protein product [Rotaria sp. Silwood1]CAF3729423.1 unnamed protein product [Rotaria sp. Silwood1]CAF3759570.1 unnamed protein product [Rotaria sp. Silwood1]